ncbi:MAG: hypothetical protein WBZ19_09250, partial [Chthoniobacterales bacterium]
GSKEHRAPLAFGEFWGGANFLFLIETALNDWDTIRPGLNSIRRKKNGAQTRTTMIETGGCMTFPDSRSGFGPARIV